MTHSNSFLRGCAALAGLVLAACAFTPNGPADGLSVEQRFPITVEPHMEALRLPFNAARGGLDQAGSADLERFARDYLDNGSGTLAIAGSRRNPNAPGTIADRLVALGVPRDRIMVGNPDNADASDDIRLSYIRYQAHAEDCGAQEDVLATSQLRMKAGPDLDQRREAAVDSHTAAGRRGDAGQELEQRALASAVPPDDADRCATVRIKSDVFQRPETVRVALRAEPILLAEPFDADVNRRHTTSASVRSACLK